MTEATIIIETHIAAVLLPAFGEYLRGCRYQTVMVQFQAGKQYNNRTSQKGQVTGSNCHLPDPPIRCLDYRTVPGCCFTSHRKFLQV